MLQRAVHGGTVTRHDRATALLQLRRIRPADVSTLLADSRLPSPGRGARGALIGVSGLDGAGKSTQAIALRDLLNAMGIDAVIE